MLVSLRSLTTRFSLAAATVVCLTGFLAMHSNAADPVAPMPANDPNAQQVQQLRKNLEKMQGEMLQRIKQLQQGEDDTQVKRFRKEMEKLQTEMMRSAQQLNRVLAQGAEQHSRE